MNKNGSTPPFKLVLTGPECSGKTHLAELLHQQLNWPLVSEVSRSYLENLNRDYNMDDVLEIARLQVIEEKKALESNPPGIICDTNVLNIIVWLEIKFGRVPDQVWQEYELEIVDLYALCTPDFRYEWDPLREDPGRRDMIFDYHLRQLLVDDQSFVIIAGSPKSRLEYVLKHLDELGVILGV